MITAKSVGARGQSFSSRSLELSGEIGDKPIRENLCHEEAMELVRAVRNGKIGKESSSLAEMFVKSGQRTAILKTLKAAL